MMLTTQCQLTVLFEDPFWIGLFERTDEEGYAVARTVFGSEPTNPEIYDFILKRFATLEFSAPLASAPDSGHPNNFKRTQREAKKLSAERGIGTKAQLALKLELEQTKQEQKTASREERDEDKRRKFLLRQEHNKEKHRGH